MKLFPSIIYVFILIINYGKIFAQGEDCPSATLLTNVTNYCSGATQYTNIGSTASGQAMAACWTGTPDQDVWFSFTATGTDAFIVIKGTGNAGATIIQPRILMLISPCSGSMMTLGCSNGTATSPGNGQTQLYQGGLVLGNTYFIRISTTQANEGTFQLCINNYTPPNNPGADCAGAAILCNKDVITVPQLSGAGTNNDEPESGSCMDVAFVVDEANTAWYTFTAATSGTLTMDIIPTSPTDDMDFTFYELIGGTANICSTSGATKRKIRRCTASGCTALNNGAVGMNMIAMDSSEAISTSTPYCTGQVDAYVKYVDLVAGRSYALLVNNANANGSFSINWGGTSTFQGPTAVITSSATTICAGQAITYNGSGSANYNALDWSFNSGGNPTTATGSGPHIITYSTPGNYVAILQATNAQGCKTVETVNITVNPPVTLTANSATICEGAAATITATAGTGGGTYSWSPGGQTTSAITVSPVISTTYTVTYSVSGCANTATGAVTVNSGPAVTVNSSTICAGGTAILTAAGGTTYVWSTAATTTSINVSPGVTTSYTVTATSSGCSKSVIGVVTVTTPPAMTASGNNPCAGSAINLISTGGSSWSWTGPNSFTSSSQNPIVPSATTAMSGVYTITGTTAGCTGTATVNITVNPNPVPTISGTTTICPGQSTTLTAGGGGTYSWSNSATTTIITVTPSSTTTYTLTTTNSGCTGSTTIAVTVGSGIVPNITGTTSICPGGSTTLTATGGGTYVWNTGVTNDAIIVSPTIATSYSVTVTNGSCTGTATVQVNILIPPSPTISGTTTICNGTGTILTATGGNTYSWNTGATNTAITVSPIANTSYTVTATALGCTGSASVAVTVNNNPAPAITGATVICAGSSTTLTATAGGTYSWNTGVGTAAITVSPAVNTTYTVTVTNAGCTGSTSVVVTVAANLVPTITGATTICNGASTTLSTSGGNSYSWNDGSTGTAITVSPTTPTSYSVTVTNGTCSGTASVQVNVVNNPTPNISGNSSICPGTSTTLSASGGTTYLWDNGQTTSSITVSPSSATTYTATASISGCIGFTTVTVNITPPPVPSITGITTICSGGSTILTATAGGTYLWNTGATTNNITVSPNTTSSYSVVVTTGCSASATVQVNVQASLNPTITGASSICPGGNTTLTATGGGTYVWNTGVTNDAIIVSPTIATSYSVTVTNGSCTGTATVQVNILIPPSPTISGTTTICNGTGTILTATGGNTYSWNTGATNTAITVSPIANTSYTVTATALGCTGSASVAVTVNNNPAPAITGATAICAGSSTTLTATTGGAYSWNTGASTATITVSPTVNTTYTVTVANAGCTGSASVAVTVAANLVATITGTTTICNGASTTLSTSGGSTYSWNNGSTTSSITVNPVNTSTYSVTVSNGLCIGTASKVVVVDQNPNPVITGDTTICSGENTTLTANSGGTYSWNTGSTAAVITVSPNVNSNYTVIVNTNGCSGSASIQITVNPTPVPLITGITSICSGQSTILSSGPSGLYSWNTGETTNNITVTPTSMRTYSVSITINGCTGTAATTVTVTPPVIATITGNNICAGDQLILIAGGGTNYLWNTGATTATINDNPSTTNTYNVIVSTGNCKDTATYTVTVNPLPTITISADTTIGYGKSAPLYASGGIMYQWTPATGLNCSNCANPTATPKATTQYCVIVKDSSGCINKSCVIINVELKCGFEGELFVPNGFSPNEDGQNDILYVRGQGIVTMYWAIYDRWGEKVFETTDPAQGWDGTYKGKALDPAVFIYYLKVTCITGNELSQQGNVAIIR